MAKLNWSQKPTQPHENNGGAEVKVPTGTAPGNKTKSHPGSGPKSESAWKWYGVKGSK